MTTQRFRLTRLATAGELILFNLRSALVFSECSREETRDHLQRAQRLVEKLNGAIGEELTRRSTSSTWKKCARTGCNTRLPSDYPDELCGPCLAEHRASVMFTSKENSPS